MFRKMPFLLLVVILLVFFVEPMMSLPVKSFIYSLSLSIKSLIIFVLPIIIFSLLFTTTTRLSKGATRLILGIIILVCCSNFLSTMLSYQVGRIGYNMDLSIATPSNIIELLPMWVLNLPKLIPNDYAMFLGLGLGIIMTKIRPQVAEKIAKVLDKIVHQILRFLMYVIPIFIAGFVVKLCHDKVIHSIVSDYAIIFALVAAAQVTYIVLIYWVTSAFKGRAFLTSIKNMLPAAIAGFGSMSSAAALPLTIIGTEKNTSRPEIARAVIPSTVNIHLIGDCFAIPIFAFAVLKNFGAPEPAFISYLIFALFFVLAKFSVAAIPGGGIIVMLPILEKYLGFNGEMMSLITALYILFDPVITSINVLGNGGFAKVVDRVHARIFKKEIANQET